MDQNERPRFYEGQYLGAADLSAATMFGRVAQARHALGAHTWGIAIGLDLVERKLSNGDVQVSVAPGVAWDGYARPVVVLAPAVLSLELFRDLPDTLADGLLVSVWIRYDETETGRPAPGFELCNGADQHARVIESFVVEVGEPVTAHGSLSIAGRAVEAAKARAAFNPGAPDVHDESVPYQAFPESGNRPPWWIPIGKVRWLKLPGQPGRVLARNDSGAGGRPRESDLVRACRRYIGVVAESIHAADGVIRMRDRWSDPDPAKTLFQPPLSNTHPAKPAPVNDLLWVEGNLRVLGNARAGGCNPLRFTNKWTGFPDAAINQAEICNDTADYKTLMIVGNRSAGLGPGFGRRVSVWDRLEVNGDLNVTGTASKPGGGTWTVSSDLALKKQVEPLTGALDRLLRLRGVRFEWKEPAKMGNLSGPQLGFVAQEVAPAFPEWVSRGADGYQELTIRGFEALAVEALRELKGEIDHLKARLAVKAPRRKGTR